MLQLILTHPGGVHKDDFLACCVLLSQSAVPIERRDPSEADLNDATIGVVDIGLQHCASLNNFDHHQFPREQVPTCALSLVLQKLELYADAREFCDWLEVAEWIDCRGPVATAEWLGIGRDALAQLNSPIDITLLRRFAAQHTGPEPVWEVMRMIGQDLVDYITSLRQRLDYIADHAEIWELNGFKALYMPRTEPLPDEPSAGLGRYIERQGLSDTVIAMVYPDRRAEGYGMRRVNDEQSMDFTQLKDEPDVHFTHAQGFIAKTSASDPQRLRQLLAKSTSD